MGGRGIVRYMTWSSTHCPSLECTAEARWRRETSAHVTLAATKRLSLCGLLVSEAPQRRDPVPRADERAHNHRTMHYCWQSWASGLKGLPSARRDKSGGVVWLPTGRSVGSEQPSARIALDHLTPLPAGICGPSPRHTGAPGSRQA